MKKDRIKTCVTVKRVYTPPSQTDGLRVLVDRLWPRGLSKKKAGVALWLKDVAPSRELRKWFNHDPRRWKEFQTKYKEELNKNKEHLMAFVHKARSEKTITLLYAASDPEHNNAVVLSRVLGVMFREK